jgi:hypothetical protein
MVCWREILRRRKSCSKLIKMIREIGIVFLLLILLSCSSKTSDNSNRMDTRNPKNSSSGNDSMDTLTLERKRIFQDYLNQLIDSLNKNTFPSFLYNECLDIEEAAYCNLGSHKSVSLRFDLLKSLQKQQLRKLLELADLTKLKRICKINYANEKLFGTTSTYNLLKQIDSMNSFSVDSVTGFK